MRWEKRIAKEDISLSLLRESKRFGFSDEQIGTLCDVSANHIRELRIEWNLRPVYKTVDTCAAEFEAVTPYFYSTYEQENEAIPLDGPKALVVGSGPIRIGQGIEFDYCSVHAAWALHKEGVKSIMINSNPETVSTDFDISTRLYFEPLDGESLKDIIDNESQQGDHPPSLVQFGGQTGLDLSQILNESGFPILGSSAAVIDMASDRQKFEAFLSNCDIPKPLGDTVTSIKKASKVAENIGYPVVVRPSYVSWR